ncbi:Putidaredoxin reductase [Streptococcus pneumoniae]|nr:Putidaredoxin reductase [Streptococcus pneumoniae]
MAVGIRPYTEVAKAAGLDVNRGIIVNEFMQTNDPNKKLTIFMV